MGRSPCCDKMGLKKGPWTPEEDHKLLAYVQQHGHGSWRALSSKAGLQRCGKSCRLRWTNYLRPDIKRGKFSSQEEQTIIQLHALLGNRWSAIATHMPKRTDNEIKNYWNTHLKKRLAKMGIDPLTHKPKNNALLSSDGVNSKNAAKLSHMAQWETARLEAEARLVRESKLRSAPSTPFQITRCMDMPKAWNEGDIVKSPTSTLISASGFAARNENTTKEEECEEVHWKHTEINIDGIESSVDPFQSGWESTSVPCVEKFTDLLLLSDNNNYWNSILNMLNSPKPADDSPMF